MIYKITINDKLYEVEVDEGKASVLNTQTASSAPAAPAPAASGDAAAELAPMPGVVTEIKVTKGQRINKGDLLLILEAMKMENEVYASKSGTVAEIYVAKGTPINTGDPLALIV